MGNLSVNCAPICVMEQVTKAGCHCECQRRFIHKLPKMKISYPLYNKLSLSLRTRRKTRHNTKYSMIHNTPNNAFRKKTGIMHRTPAKYAGADCVSLRVFRQLIWLRVGSVKAVLSRPGHQPVTPSVGLLRYKLSENIMNDEQPSESTL